MRFDFTSRFIAVALLVAAVTMLPFWLGLGGDFIFDDRQTIQFNDALRIASLDLKSLLYAGYSYRAGNGSRALAMLTFAFDYWRGGADPAVFKATNVVIHAATTVTLAAFLRLLLTLAGWQPRQAAIGALSMAAVWAVHPLQVSAVLYVVQRMQTLATLFLLLALWAYMKMRRAQIEGEHGRLHGVLALLFWGLAFASKEDSALLPAYTLLLELTVLQFRAAQPRLGRRLQQAYGAMAVLGTMAYAFVVVPHYWHWDAYPGRAFSSYERLLTEARVLTMYLGQILLPLPNRLPFFYDDLSISHGLLDPPATLASVLVVLTLLGAAWRLRSKRPLFAFGVMLFFAGHFVTSNVLNLELAFEHRNHFPLVGAVIALGDLVAVARARWPRQRLIATAVAASLVCAAASATAVRAHAWGEPTRFAEYGVELAPYSVRAWTDLCTHYFDMNRGVRDSPYIDRAIATCREGAARTGSPLLLFDVIIYKTFKGSPTESDWPPFIRSLRQAPTSSEVTGVYYAILQNVEHGFPMDKAGTLQALKIVADRAPLTAGQYVGIAVYTFNNSADPDSALPFLERAVRMAPAGSPLVENVFRDLHAAGRDDWIEYLKSIRQVTSRSQSGTERR
jgi:hypothetical protein